jgi:hypothetical protein
MPPSQFGRLVIQDDAADLLPNRLSNKGHRVGWYIQDTEPAGMLQ